jgi:DNA repair protein RadA/Sms
MEPARPMKLSEIDLQDVVRMKCGDGEFDRVLGGGLVPGSAVMVGGEPGIGKSTLLLQVASTLAGEGGSGGAVLYVSSEESARQTKLRAARLNLPDNELRVLAETGVKRILHAAEAVKPAVLIVDSIQMIYDGEVPAAPGSVTQLRHCCGELVMYAKASGCAVILVGHVTKEGTLAGPKLIEHIVDTVLYFEGDRFHQHRMIRCIKNRFGATSELGLYEMTGAGMMPVAEPGGLFLQHRSEKGTVSGSVITAAMQGSRVLVVEVQALTASSVIGAARRKVSGVSSDRVGMVLAVLEKRADYRLAADDVFVSVAGGVKIAEPSADLAVALAVASAHGNRALAAGSLVLGELGLGGEVRPVPQLEQRLKEAARLGVTHAIVPRQAKGLSVKGMAVMEVRTLQQALGCM